MSLGFGLENINDIFNDGVPPEFSRDEIAALKSRAEEARRVNIPNQAVGYTKGIYNIKAFEFVTSYQRNEIPWALMTQKQRLWLLRIKDDIGNVVKQDRQKREGSKDTSR